MHACAQSTEVPQAITEAFSKKFPEAKKVKWDKENAAEWEAEFKMNGTEYSANFTSAGEWTETEHEIKTSEIPAAVKATLDQDFKDYEIEEAEISVTKEGKVYEFELEKDETALEVAIDVNGKIVTKEVKEEEEED